MLHLFLEGLLSKCQRFGCFDHRGQSRAPAGHWASALVTFLPPVGSLECQRNEKPVSISVAVDVSLQTGGDASSEGLKYLLGLISAQLACGGAEQSV